MVQMMKSNPTRYISQQELHKSVYGKLQYYHVSWWYIHSWFKETQVLDYDSRQLIGSKPS